MNFVFVTIVMPDIRKGKRSKAHMKIEDLKGESVWVSKSIPKQGWGGKGQKRILVWINPQEINSLIWKQNWNNDSSLKEKWRLYSLVVCEEHADSKKSSINSSLSLSSASVSSVSQKNCFGAHPLTYLMTGPMYEVSVHYCFPPFDDTLPFRVGDFSSRKEWTNTRNMHHQLTRQIIFLFVIYHNTHSLMLASLNRDFILRSVWVLLQNRSSGFRASWFWEEAYDDNQC